MSLDSILRTARKLGIPVVITNDRGESPQVVMPFEDFASMVGVSPATVSGKPRITRDAFSEDDLDSIDMTDGFEPDEHDFPGEGEADENFIVKGAEPEVRDPDAATSGSLEDQFYFEPTDDQETP